MKTCTYCWSQNNDSALFCESCGHPFFRKCQYCGETIKPAARFCPYCGTPIIIEEQQHSDLIIFANGISFKMIYVKGGTFKMGTCENDADTQPDERPQHNVTLSDFYIGETKVTAELWKAVMGDIPIEYSEWTQYSGYTEYKNEYKPNFPVQSASFLESEAFIECLNRITGKKFRFPTEAEWEYAARGGQKSRGYRYAGTDNYEEIAWPSHDVYPIKQKKPNELGLYDMCDTQGEWCSDYYDFKFYSRSPQFDPCNTIETNKRVLRGGVHPKYCKKARPTFRGSGSEDEKGGLLTLRLAMSI